MNRYLFSSSVIFVTLKKFRNHLITITLHGTGFMAVERQTARKVRIRDVVNGRWVKREGMEPSYAITFYGEKVSRLEVVGTVVSTFVSEDGKFRTITIDDSTETIRLKAFKPPEADISDESEARRVEKANRAFDILGGIKVGDIIDVIGMLREYNDEIYIIPEMAKRITVADELLFRLEVLEKVIGVKRTGEIISKLREKYSDDANIEEFIRKNCEKIKPYWLRLALNKSEEPVDDRAELRKQIMKIIEISDNGIPYKELLEKVKGQDADIEAVINDLLSEGVCYEPMPGVIKKI